MNISRRSLLPLLGAAAFPRAAFGQAARGATQKVVGVIWALPETDSRIPGSIAAALQGLAEEGWINGENMRLESRSGGLERPVAAAHAEELAGLHPDVVIAAGLTVTEEVRAHVGDIPIVFFAVVDPVGAGFVETLQHPGGRITGFSNMDASLGGKWLDLLMQVQPDLTHASLMVNPQPNETGTHYVQSFQEAADRAGIVGNVVHVETVDDIVAEIERIAATPRGGLVTSTDAFLLIRRAHVVEAVARAGIPAIYGYRDYVDEGGLISYAADPSVWLRGVGTYAGRILNGELPAELPVQFPSVFRLTINLKAAAELGVSISPALIALADEIVE